jgi:hypothetical protein
MYEVIAVGHMEQSNWSLGLFLNLRVQRFDTRSRSRANR